MTATDASSSGAAAHPSGQHLALDVAVWLGFVAISFAAGLLGTLVGNTEFYQQLTRPAWAPPSWLFGPVWSVLYFAMGTSAWLVWRTGPGTQRRRAMTAFGILLVLNAAWTPVFFGLEAMGWALVVLVANVIAVAVTIAAFRFRSALAALLLAPLLAWVSFAAVLNASLWTLNR